MGRKEAFSRGIGEAIARVVFGPKTVGVVELIKRDPNDGRYCHVLVRTDGGKQKHFTLRDNRSKGYVPGEGIQVQEMSFVRGENFEMNTRGTGFFYAPGSKVERDPFNLKSTK